jgi:hypothetical protein
VDTTPAAVAVVAAPASAARGEQVRLVLKPALPLARVPDLAARPGGVGNAVKGAMEAKELLVRAPWGEVVRAQLDGPLGLYVATLRVPADGAIGEGELEVVASDAAGNVSRRRVALVVTEAPAAGAVARAAVGVGGALAFAAVVLAAFVAAAVLRRRRRPPARLDRVLLAGSVKHARER